MPQKFEASATSFSLGHSSSFFLILSHRVRIFFLTEFAASLHELMINPCPHVSFLTAQVPSFWKALLLFQGSACTVAAAAHPTHHGTGSIIASLCLYPVFLFTLAMNCACPTTFVCNPSHQYLAAPKLSAIGCHCRAVASAVRAGPKKFLYLVYFCVRVV